MAFDINSLEPEKFLLGTVLLYGYDVYDEVRPIVNADDFIPVEHRDIWETFDQCSVEQSEISAISVKEKIKNKRVDLAFLMQLMNSYPSKENAVQYAEIIKKNSLARKEIKLYQQRIQSLMNGEEPEEIISRALTEDMDLLERSSTEKTRFVGENILGLVDEIEERYKKQEHMTGLKTGFAELDVVLGGLDPDTINVLAARPGTGKTTLSLNIARNVSQVGPVYIASLEMSFEQLQSKFLSIESQINSMAFRNTVFLKDEDFDKLTYASAKISDYPIIIDDSTEMKASQLAIRLRRLKKKHNIKLVIIDYLQLMDAEKELNNRVQEITKTLKVLKKITRELKIPIWLISQMNRAVETRRDKDPIMSDLREAGSIEQDAASIMFLYKENENDKSTKPLITMKIAKNRFGPSDFKLRFEFDTQKSTFKHFKTV